MSEIAVTMQVEMLPPGGLIPFEGNPRLMRQDPDHPEIDAVLVVAESIAKYGFRQPIVIDAEGVIIVGHTRHKAALKLGLDTVPVVRAADLSEEQIKAYRIADNKTAEWTGWDLALLVEETKGLDDIPGFGPDEFAALHGVDLGSPSGGFGDGEPGSTRTNTRDSGLPPGDDEYVQLSFFVKREYAEEIKAKCNGIIESYQAGKDERIEAGSHCRRGDGSG